MLIFVWIFSGYPQIWNNPRIPVETKEAKAAATFSMQTGYYQGNGNATNITGLGWAPELVIIKSDSNTIATIWKSAAMPENTVQYLGAATADSAAGLIKLTSDGFIVTSTANTSLIRYTWTAFKGNDCTASGYMCLGYYVGSGANKNISTGFQPDLAWVKRTTAIGANWVSSAMSGGYTNFFAATVQDTTAGTYYANPAFGATYFTVAGTGTNGNSVSSAIYYFAAFRNLADYIKVGKYTAPGVAVDDTSISDVGFVPDYVFVKSAAAVAAVSNCDESYGDNASYFSATADLVNSIQKLQTGGFQIGTNGTVQTVSVDHNYVAFAGAAALSSGSGTFQMATGTYTGTGTYQAISGLGFEPDLVIVKGNTATAGVFKTSVMGGASAAYLDSATATLATAITALNGDGFQVGTHASVNTASTVYYWTAFGNAWKPNTNSGAADFYIGSYYNPATAIDARSITRLPFQADFLAVKSNAAAAGAYRTSAMGSSTTDISGFYAATAETTNNIQKFTSDGFEIGTAANVATVSVVNFYFGFKEGTNFDVGSYTGNAGSQDVTTAGTSGSFQPDYIWVKSSTVATRGVEKFSSMAAANCAPFINVAEIATAFTSIISTGFRFTSINVAETNTNLVVYRYVAWNIPVPGTLSIMIVDSDGAEVGSPNIDMPTKNLSFSCQTSTGTLGLDEQRIRVDNGIGTAAWILSISAVTTALWDGGTPKFDFNDNGSSGCADSVVDADLYGGQMTQDPSGLTISPEGGCSDDDLTPGSSTAFVEGSADSATLLTAGDTADTACYWDITGIGVSQKIPVEQAVGTYTITMTIDVIAD